MLRHAKMGQTVKQCAQAFPLLDIDAVLQPITRTVLRIRLYISANFRYVTVFLFTNYELFTEAICRLLDASSSLKTPEFDQRVVCVQFMR